MVAFNLPSAVLASQNLMYFSRVAKNHAGGGSDCSAIVFLNDNHF
jgi:hypothetical protein